jgi:hypothetical protein
MDSRIDDVGIDVVGYIGSLPRVLCSGMSAKNVSETWFSMSNMQGRALASPYATPHVCSLGQDERNTIWLIKT